MLRTILFALLSAHLVNSQSTAVPFVKGPVSCYSQTVNFAINPDNVGYAVLANYTTFGLVGVFVDHAAPSCAVDPTQVLNPWSSPNYDITISFSNCNITIDALYGAQNKLLEYSATIYARLSPVDFVGGVPTANASYPNMTFPITCNWLPGAQVSINITVNNNPSFSNNFFSNNFFSNNPQPPPPIGNTSSPVDQLNISLSDRNGNPLTEVEAGTRVRVVLSLSGDSYYMSELPEYCSISNAINPLFGTFIAVIANYCPYNNTIINSPFNFIAAQQDNNTYYFEFDTFTFNNVKTTLFITCYVQVCLNSADCYKTCWDIKSMSTKSLELEERLSHYRQIPIQLEGTAYPPIDNTIRHHRKLIRRRIGRP